MATMNKKDRRVAELSDVLGRMLDMFKEDHEATMAEEGDAHEDDCSYCRIFREATEVLSRRAK